MRGAHPHPTENALLARLFSLFHRVRSDNGRSTELPQPSRPSAFHIHALLARLSSLIHSSPSENDTTDELQQPSTPWRVDPRVLLARLSSFLHRSRLNTDEEAEPHPITPLSSRSDALTSRLTSIFRFQSHANEDIELAQRPRRPRVVDVAAVRDKQVCIPPSPFLIAVVQSFCASHCLLPAAPNVTRRHRHNSSNLNRTARDRLQHRMLQALMLLRRVQDLPIHDLYDCWLISCSFSAAHPLNVPVPIYNQHRFNCKDKRRPMRHRRKHSTIKVNHKAHPRLRRHRHSSLLPPPHPQHLLLLMLILLRHVQHVCSHAPCHCGLVSFFSSAVHLSHTQTVTNTASSGRLSHFSISLSSFNSCSMCVFNFTTSSISILFRTLCRDASILFSSSR
jgi:hypothetical protein